MLVDKYWCAFDISSRSVWEPFEQIYSPLWRFIIWHRSPARQSPESQEGTLSSRQDRAAGLPCTWKVSFSPNTHTHLLTCLLSLSSDANSCYARLIVFTYYYHILSPQDDILSYAKVIKWLAGNAFEYEMDMEMFIQFPQCHSMWHHIVYELIILFPFFTIWSWKEL